MNVANIPDMLGLVGALISGVAYYPQIKHIITEHCSAGISLRAYGLWLSSSILITISAFYAQSTVFIVLGCVQTLATVLVVVFSRKYQSMACEFHMVDATLKGQGATQEKAGRVI